MSNRPGSGGPAIEVFDLSRSFGNFLAVDRITFSVVRGEIFGFLGANGAGKSTTIRILCGLLAPSGGRGSVLGCDLMTESERIKPQVGYMSQRFSLYPDLTVRENLEFFGGIYGVERQQLARRMAWAVGMAGLKGRERDLTAELPAGLKQRLALGAALLHEPQMIFLDEPTAGVAPDARRAFWDLIRDLAGDGVTVFVTTHYMDEVEQCDRIALMNRGRIAALDTPAGLKRDAIGGRLVRFVCDAPLPAVRAALEGAGGASDIQPFGAAYHALVGEGNDPAGRVAALAAAAGLSVSEVGIVAPTLEDVFIAVIGREAVR